MLSEQLNAHPRVTTPADRPKILSLRWSQIAQVTSIAKESNALLVLGQSFRTLASEPSKGIKPGWCEVLQSNLLEYAKPNRAAEAASNQEMINGLSDCWE
jgi:cobalamin biosynthesis protein CbiG